MPVTRSQTKKRKLQQAHTSPRNVRGNQQTRSIQAEPIELMSQADERATKVSELLELLSRPDDAQTSSQMGARTNSALDFIRKETSSHVYTAVGHAAANDERIFEQVQEILVVEKARRRALDVLHNYDHGSMSVEETALIIQSSAEKLHPALYRRARTATFAAGVLIMILDEVVDRAAPGGTLYDRLMSNPPTEKAELCVVDLLTVGEDVLKPYMGQMQGILAKFERMSPSLLPRPDMIRRLREKVQPALNRSI